MTTGDSYARVCAAGAFWQLTSNVDLSLPIIIAEMPGFNRYGKGLPAGILEEMGPRAKAAFPMLSKELASSQGPDVFATISNALIAIDPEAAVRLFTEKSESISTNNFKIKLLKSV